MNSWTHLGQRVVRVRPGRSVRRYWFTSVLSRGARRAAAAALCNIAPHYVTHRPYPGAQARARLGHQAVYGTIDAARQLHAPLLDERRQQIVQQPHDLPVAGELNTWSNYKNWAERVRTAWSEETPAAEDAPAPFTDPPVPPNH